MELLDQFYNGYGKRAEQERPGAQSSAGLMAMRISSATFPARLHQKATINDTQDDPFRDSGVCTRPPDAPGGTIRLSLRRHTSRDRATGAVSASAGRPRAPIVICKYVDNVVAANQTSVGELADAWLGVGPGARIRHQGIHAPSEVMDFYNAPRAPPDARAARIEPPSPVALPDPPLPDDADGGWYLRQFLAAGRAKSRLIGLKMSFRTTALRSTAYAAAASKPC
jgi:hypothetical protein